jgi:hypothetical protein
MSKSGKTARPPQKRRTNGGQKLRNGLDPSIGKATQIKRGEVRNPGGRPKSKLLSEAYRTLLATEFPGDKKGRTYAELIAEGQLREAIKGKTPAAKEAADRTEGPVTQQHEVVSHSPINIKVDAPDLLATLRQIYGLSSGSGDSVESPEAVSVPEKVDSGPVKTKDSNQGT